MIAAAPKRGIINTANFRQDAYLSIGLHPLVAGLGHLAPAVGAAYSMLGRWYLDWPVLIMIASTTALVDACDHYRDIPRSQRPPRSLIVPWLIVLALTVLASCVACGFATAIRLQRWLALGLLWGVPCIPFFSFKQNTVSWTRPKSIFREAKSLVAGIALGMGLAESAALHACLKFGGRCHWDVSEGSGSTTGSVYWRAVALSVLYNCVMETLCDIRDVDEDKEDSIPTLPVRWGKKNAMWILATVAFLAEIALSSSNPGFYKSREIVGGVFGWSNLLRPATAMIGGTIALSWPKEHKVAWSIVPLFALLPATWGQYMLGTRNH